MRTIHLPFGVLWRFILIRLDRLVPLQVTRLTSHPPYPFVVRLLSRDFKHKIPVHISIPQDLDLKADESLPVHVDFHGGGFFMGSCLEQAPFCATVAQQSRRIVLTVDYPILNPRSAAGKTLREALQERLPRPREDTDIIDIDRISLSGFSAGGNIALNLVLNVKTVSEKWPSPLVRKSYRPFPVLLFYPSFDQTLPEHERPLPSDMEPSRRKKIRSQTLHLAEFLTPTYLSEADRYHPRASPGLADLKSFLPNANFFLVLTGIDTLCVQSDQWIEKVEAQGESDRLDVVRCPDMVHGFTQFPAFAQSKEQRAETERVFGLAMEYLDRFWKADEKG